MVLIEDGNGSFDVLLTVHLSIILVINQLNLLAPELFFLILANPVYKTWIIQEPNALELWNKLHFEKEKSESIYHVLNIHYLYFSNKYIKCNFRG